MLSDKLIIRVQMEAKACNEIHMDWDLYYKLCTTLKF